MTQLLLVGGIFVFFISVYGAVMVGGHLLADLQDRDIPDDRSERRVDGGSSPARQPTRALTEASPADATY